MSDGHILEIGYLGAVLNTRTETPGPTRPPPIWAAGGRADTLLKKQNKINLFNLSFFLAVLLSDVGAVVGRD
jgi:hypothetical protein